jgi:hypothetical protein
MAKEIGDRNQQRAFPGGNVEQEIWFLLFLSGIFLVPPIGKKSNWMMKM